MESIAPLIDIPVLKSPVVELSHLHIKQLTKYTLCIKYIKIPAIKEVFNQLRDSHEDDLFRLSNVLTAEHSHSHQSRLTDSTEAHYLIELKTISDVLAVIDETHNAEANLSRLYRHYARTMGMSKKLSTILKLNEHQTFYRKELLQVFC